MALRSWMCCWSAAEGYAMDFMGRRTGEEIEKRIEVEENGMKFAWWDSGEGLGEKASNQFNRRVHQPFRSAGRCSGTKIILPNFYVRKNQQDSA